METQQVFPIKSPSNQLIFFKQSQQFYLYLLNIGNVLRLLGMGRPTNDSHVGGKNNLHIGVDDIFLEGGIVCHVEENGGQLRCPVTSSAAKEAAAICLDQQSNPLENLVQDLFHRVAALYLFDELKDELGLLDGGQIFVGCRVFDLHLVVEGGRDHISLHFLLIIDLGKVGVVVQELLHSVFVCHVEGSLQ